MKVEGELDIQIHREEDEDGRIVKLRIRDAKARVEFLELKIDADWFMAALGAQASCPCSLEIRDGSLSKLGKSQETKTFEFKLDNADSWKDKDAARTQVTAVTPEGWVADTQFNSQGSFYTKGAERWARTVIRRWI